MRYIGTVIKPAKNNTGISLRVVYDQMLEPKYTVAMGACAMTEWSYFDSYNILPGVDNILPAGVYVLGCPPRPETMIQAIMLLQERKSKKRNEESVEISFLYGTCTGT